jgi:uncharacterized membrane protein YdjX (TVP38/TMEM64 family)
MRQSVVIRLALVAAIAVVIATVAYYVPVLQYLSTFLEWIQGRGPIGLVLLAALYVPASLLFLPAWPLTLGAGFVFGVVRGTIAVSIGSVLGASAAFWTGRSLLRQLIEDRVARTPRFAAIDRAVAQHGFKIVLLTRLSPIFPFNLLNYAFGITKVTFRDYLLASWIGMLPGTLLYVYLGTAAKSLADLFSGRTDGGTTERVTFAMGLVATILATILIARIAKQTLKREINETSPTLPS